MRTIERGILFSHGTLLSTRNDQNVTATVFFTLWVVIR